MGKKKGYCLLMFIESLGNKVYKYTVSLKNKKAREEEGVFLAEGVRLAEEIPKDWEICYYVFSESFYKSEKMQEKWKDKKFYIFTDKLFSHCSDTKNPQGILAVVKKKQFPFEELLEKQNLFLIIGENLNDPGNLGTIIRTADAGGADAVFLSKDSVEVYNPKVLRASMGSVFHIPVIENMELDFIIEMLHKKKVKLYAAHLKGKKTPYALPLKNSCGFFIGNEANGLSEKISAAADCLVKIPMPGAAESLNASVAAGILIYEVVRQRMGE